MQEATTFIQTAPVASPKDTLSEVLRDGVRRMLAVALEAEAEACISANAGARDEAGQPPVVRNGHRRPRSTQGGSGPGA